MITKLTLQNFKSITEQSYEFKSFDLLVGHNNSGKSTILQALSIWQFCVDEFRRTKRTGTKGIQVVLPNFTPLPLPEFNLLWREKTDRHWPVVEGRKKQQYILISINVEWQREGGKLGSLKIDLRYHSPQTIYAIPADGWAKFREHEENGLPTIAYVPPFSGLEPTEKWLDFAPMRQQVGKGQPGSVLRNLLLRVASPTSWDYQNSSQPSKDDWKDLAETVKKWFSVDLDKPKYDSAQDVNIKVNYKQNARSYDIIAGGSGFHQSLTLLAFLYGYKPTTILLDEPDAHLHVNLQRKILDFFKQKSIERGIQFLIATHAEEFVKGVDASQIVSLLSLEPKRVESAPSVIRALSDVSNEEVTALMTSPYILYIEGESDERILRSWAQEFSAQDFIKKIYFKTMKGGSKKHMRKRSDEHFSALSQIVPNAKRMILFDYDDDETAFHPEDNPVLFEWRRKNIENYLLVKEAWIRAAEKSALSSRNDLFFSPILKVIDDFFSGENLFLPPGKDWRNLDANIFKIVDGKKLLFGGNKSLFQILMQNNPPVYLTRDQVAGVMKKEEIHQDVHEFMERLGDFAG